MELIMSEFFLLGYVASRYRYFEETCQLLEMPGANKYLLIQIDGIQIDEGEIWLEI